MTYSSHTHHSETDPTVNFSAFSGKKVAVMGARGYAGLELCRILLKHSAVTLTGCFSADASFKLSDYLSEPAATAVPTLAITGKSVALPAKKLDCVFLATPAEASMEWAPYFLSQGIHVIDLSGAFRLNESDYPKWYGFKHEAAAALKTAEYGLVPFGGPATSVTGARLIANPGCYATAVAMALIPLLKQNLIQADSIVIDAKSGASGAGRKANENLLFTEVDQECLPYKSGSHQHLPEIIQTCQKFSGSLIDPFFTPHLLPVRRGIIASIYAQLKTGVNSAQISAAFQEAYAHYPLAQVGQIPEKETPASRHALSLKRISGSAKTSIQFKVDGSKLYLFSLIDNLLKGAASQAVENLNRILDLPVDTGVKNMEGNL